ncbi:MAG: AIR carboxylase family protein, partial [Candidatus Omnitrophica bacterium]|nr:AIR carboxylase family protein [Candidatus Omnitrophota bacterium]
MKIHIIMGSKSDMPIAEKAQAILDEFNVAYTLSVASAHRTPELLKNLITQSDADVFIG